MKRFLTNVSLQHEPKASDVITIVKKTFVARVSYEILYHEVWNKRKKMLGRILKVVNKVRRSVVRMVLGRLWLFGNGIPVSFFRLCLECSHKIEIKYSEKGTLGQRQRYPLPSRSLWPMTVAAVVTDELSRTEHNLRRSVFKYIFDNFFVIIGNGEFNHTGIKCRGGQNHRQQIVAGEIPETIRASVQTVHRVAKWKKMFFVFLSFQ